MNLVNPFVREYVAPVLRSHGFIGSSPRFLLGDQEGDCALVAFAPQYVDPNAVVFEAHAHICPKVYWDWLMRYGPEPKSKRTQGEALVTWPIFPPDPVAHCPGGDSPFGNRWFFTDEESRARCGKAITDVLAADSVPLMRELSDRRRLRAELQDPSFVMMKRMSKEMRDVLLAVDDEPVDEVEGLITVAEAADSPPDFVSWVKKRLYDRN